MDDNFYLSEESDKDSRIIEALDKIEFLAKSENSSINIKEISSREPKYGEFPEFLNPDLIEAIRKIGINSLFSHQEKAIKHINDGKNVVIVTPTASGKTLCYNIPVLNSIINEISPRAFYLFPTKALSQDQRAELDEITNNLNLDIKIFTYDGDTPQDARKAIRTQGHIIITNPDMLHTGILPHHTKWIKTFENLRYVVIDELHHYKGVFGSHLANIIRRLKRICKFYGSKPQYILSSATISNPKELAEKMIEEEVTLIDENGAPSGEKYFVFFNPPVVNRSLGIRKSYVNETRNLSTIFIKNKLQTIIFTQTRLLTEVLVNYLKEGIEKGIKDEGLIRGYRGGYLPLKRREIEKDLREGKILGVVSTNALELGIDIGSLDVSVLAGYPGTISSTWQRAGRAGRRKGKSVAILVASSSPLDQFIVNNPDYFFEKNPEKGLINPDNLSILLSHIKCAAFELPFEKREKFGNENLEEFLKFLEEDKFLHYTDDKWFWISESYPADAISLRSVTSDNFVVVDITGRPKVIAEVDYTSALEALHEKAIYMVEGEQYYVEKLDFNERKAMVKKVNVDYFTDAITYTNLKILDVFQRKKEFNSYASEGEVHVQSQVVGFKKIKFHTMESVGAGELSLPEQEIHTSSYWVTIPKDLYQNLPFKPDEKVSGIFGISYLFHHIAPLFLMCDWKDLGVTVGDNSTGQSLPNRNVIEKRMRTMRSEVAAYSGEFEPNIFVWDNYPGGVGFSQGLYDCHEELIKSSIDIINSCPCYEGCPSCIGPSKETGKLAKKVALYILNKLLS
ncbi:MAG: DEAD/DEAH box helicase [Acidobacteriota bacterium]